MLFVDETIIHVKAGDGGNGCESFYRDKYLRKPRPDGGDGGKGGDIIVKASKSVHTLLDFKFRQNFSGERGLHASSKGQNGKRGQDSILLVPVGTVIFDEEGLTIKDLNEDGQQVIVAKGGKGGLGNKKRGHTVQPEQGEARTIRLELKIVADVGLIGFPNAGKSTLINAISKVKSPVANYPFTTKQPILGIVQDTLDEKLDFVIADLPGIIEDAHLGKGLGDRFLRHAERTRILVQVIDMAGVDGRDPLEDYQKLNHELEAYGDLLALKEKVVVANKLDLEEAVENLKRFKKKFKVTVIKISAMNKEGLEKLLKAIREKMVK